MSDPDALAIGKLMLRDAELEKRRGELVDVARRRAITFARTARLLNQSPDRLRFTGEVFDGDPAGEEPFDRADLDVGSLIAVLDELRQTIAARTELREQLADAGVDLDAIEEEENQRKSRALRFPALEVGEEKAARPIGFAARDEQATRSRSKPARAK